MLKDVGMDRLREGLKLAVFDIDGTLTNTNDIDLRSYIRALADEFSIDAAGLRWSDYPHVTDIGITNDVFRAHFGRIPQAAEVERLQSRLLALFDEALAAEPGLVTAIAGAQRVLDHLRDAPDWALGIATGCWQASATWKLRAAGLDVSGIPAAFCEDGISREEIVAAAMRRAATACGDASFASVVSIGDGEWDVATAVRLNLAFVGVRCDGDKGFLYRHGAKEVLVDYADLDAALLALERAEPPAP